MKKFFALLALVLGVVSCQTEPEGFDVNVGGEQDVNITVSLPEGTRANSAEGAFCEGNVDFTKYDVRFQCEVHYNGQVKVLPVQYGRGNDAVTTATFPVRLIANRNYTFVVWADLVKEGETADLHYNTTGGLTNITLNDDTWVAMDETRDAFTCSETRLFERGEAINLTLTRPFAKLRVITTDIDELMGIKPTWAKVEYITPYYTSFNAYDQKPYALSSTAKEHSELFDIVSYGESGASKTLFTDYFFAINPENGQAPETVAFTLEVFDEGGATIDEVKKFNTSIPVKRNYVTTIKGDILTYADHFTVTIDDAFANADNIEDAPYYQAAVTNGADLLKAIREGREIIVLNHITVTAADANFDEGTTRATNAKFPVINLNNCTITIENNGTDALVDLQGGTLTVEGEGSIVSNDGALVEGTTVVTEGATVEAEVAVDENGNSAVKTGVEALAHICKNGGEFTFTENLEAAEVILIETTKPVVINGNNKTLTSSASRAIRVASSKANVTINDLNIVVTTERVYPNDVRGISIDAQLSNVELTLNNCSVDFTHATANDWAYAVNVSGNGTGHKVTINGGTYNGANVVNVHGANNTIVVKNATLNCTYPFNDLYAGACIWVLQNQGTTVYAEGNTFNGNNAWAFNLGTGTALEEKNNTDNTKYVAVKVNGAYYYNIAEAITAAEDGATITVLQNHDCTVGATVPAGKTLTLDLNGKTVNGTDTITASFGLITNKGNLTIIGNGKMTLKAKNNREWNAYSSVISNTVGGKLVVENGTIEHLGGTDMAYGIDNLTNGKGTYAETVINGGTIKSTYRAVRMFLNGIEAQNLLTVNGGIIEGANKSIWMQDPSKNANTGKLVVNEGATLNGDVYLFVTAGSTEWPVEVSIAASAVNGEVLTGNVPTGYEVVENNGVWTVVAYEKVADGLFKKENAYVVTNAEGLAALNAMMVNKTAGKAVKVTLGADIDFAGKTWTPVDSHADTKFSFSELDGKGYTISNLTINGQAMFTRFAGAGDVTIKNVTFDNANVNSKGSINTSILTGHTYQNVLLDNVDVKNSTINGGYKVAPLIATVYNEGASTITATLKNCDVENTVVKATSYDFCTTGMVAFVYEGDNDRIVFENCSVKGVQLYAPNAYTAHAAIYTAGSETLYNEAEGVVVENVTFENI